MKLTFSGYSDDCTNIYLDKKCISDSEYSEKIFKLKTKSGEEFIFKFKFGYGWETVVEIPDDCSMVLEEFEYGEEDSKITFVEL